MDKLTGALVAAFHRLAVLLGLRQELPVHPVTGLRAIGVLPSGRVVWPVLGGAPDDDEDDDEGEEDDEGQDDDEEDDDEGVDDKAKDGKAAGKKPTGEEKVSRAELNKAVAARQAAKKALREAKAELAKLKQANETSADKAAREAREAAEQAAEKRYKPVAIRAALLEAGVKAAKVKGAVRLLEMDDVEVDESGEVTGLDGQLDTLREDWPELFGGSGDGGGERPARKGSRSVDGADKKPSRKELSASERQAAQLLGK